MPRELIRLSPALRVGDTFDEEETSRSQESQLDKSQYNTRVGHDLFETRDI